MKVSAATNATSVPDIRRTALLSAWPALSRLIIATAKPAQAGSRNSSRSAMATVMAMARPVLIDSRAARERGFIRFGWRRAPHSVSKSSGTSR
jgi:hypothetical protein